MLINCAIIFALIRLQRLAHLISSIYLALNLTRRVPRFTLLFLAQSIELTIARGVEFLVKNFFSNQGRLLALGLITP
jgi:hypothetical protein